MPDVLMPRLSDTMTEGILSQWLKQEGDAVERGEIIAEIETDKAVMELEAYDSGPLTKILVQAGTTVPIGTPIAVIGESDHAADTGGSTAAETPAQPAAPEPGDTAEPEPASAVPSADSGRESSEPGNARRIRATPLVRSLAREHGLDLSDITGTGPGGRIVRADVDAYVAAQRAAGSPQAPAASPGGAAPAPAELPVATAGPDDETQPLSAVRRITAERLTASVRAPHFYLTAVVDAEPLLALRAQLNEQLAATGTKLSVTDLLIRACAVELRAHPDVNASWGGDQTIRRRHVNVGCAVAITDGLIVPVIRDADRKSASEISGEAHDLIERARAGKLVPDEFSGGTFTISNLGMFGIDHFTAVINPPEAAILAVGAAREEAVVRDGRIVVGTTMKLTLSIDHRVLDGASAAVFLRDLVELLEHPLRALA